MPSRAGQSIATALDPEFDVGLACSMKEYEDIAFRLLKKKSSEKLIKKSDSYVSELLWKWRAKIKEARVSSRLFDVDIYTDSFERYIEAVWELQHLHRERQKKFHVFTSNSIEGYNAPRFSNKSHKIETYQMQSSSRSFPKAIVIDHDPNSKYPPIPEYVYDGRWIMLNIGGFSPAKDWLLVNNKVFHCFCFAYLGFSMLFYI